MTPLGNYCICFLPPHQGPKCLAELPIRILLDHKAGEKALIHIKVVTAALPNNPNTGRIYAEFLDELNRPEDALVVWKKVRDLDPNLELAHYRVTRLLMGNGSLAGAFISADAGLAAAPHSARLYVAKSEILEKQGAFYKSRNVLRKAPDLDDAALQHRLSEMEDVSGRGAAVSYLRLAELLEKEVPRPAEYILTDAPCWNPVENLTGARDSTIGP